jgi:oligosaccharide repeat unit polymerase
MTVPSLIAWSVVLVLVTMLVLRKGDPLAPSRIMALVWAIAIGLAEMKLSAYQHTWSTYSWIVLLTGPVSFLLGAAAVAATRLWQPLLSVDEVRTRLRGVARAKYDETRFFRAITVLFFAYVAAFLIETAVEGGVPLFAARPDVARIEFGFFGVHLIVTWLVALDIVAIEYLLVMKPARKRFWATVAMILVATLLYALLLQRYFFFTLGVVVLAMAYYTTRWVRPRTMMPFGIVFGLLLFQVSQLRAAKYVQAYVYVISRMRFSKDLWFLAEPYMYVSMNLENFTRAVDKLDAYSYGYFLLDPFLALVGLKHWLAEYFNIERLPFLISGYNTFPFHFPYYQDFGVAGVAVFPFLTGLAIAYFYYKLRMDPDPRTLVFYSCGVFVMVISFFVNPLLRLEFTSNLFMIWLMHRLALRGSAATERPGAPAGTRIPVGA